ncbi:hypothetical protein LWI28_012593 [Acer negundo]|uniref:Pentatricopeptide repeat-containing protein n=1 Tax=Acer negundo TaxID=4023 RepID=A0AAD5J066_ACENE|nr:hypothetical protein LWI28_012593 [Acer negundo]
MYSMINGYVKRREIATSQELFVDMPNRDVILWNLMISGYISCGGSKFLEEGRQLFDVMLERDCVSWNTMISGYAKNGRMEDALRLFNSMPQRDVVSRNAIVSGFYRMEMWHVLLIFLSECLSGLCFGKCTCVWSDSEWLHNNVELARVAADALMKLEPESSTLYVLLYNMCADLGQWDEASEVRMMMKSNKIKKPSVIAVSSGTMH